MKSWLVYAAIMILSACACSSEDQSGDMPEELSMGDFSERSRCINVWQDLFDQWRDNGGGIQESILETRQQIANDDQSELARIIREGWSRQNEGHAERLEGFGYWPVSDEQFRQATYPLLGILPDYVPERCATASWMVPLVWNELRFVDEDPMSALRPVEVPEAMTWNSVSAPTWTTYWLLVRVAAEPDSAQ